MTVRFINGISLRNRLQAFGISSALFPLDGAPTPNFAYALFPLTSAFVGLPVARVRDVQTGNEANVLGSSDSNITDASPIIVLPGGTNSTLGAWRTPGGSLAVRSLYQQGAVLGVNLEQDIPNNQPLLMSNGLYITIGNSRKTTLQSIGQAGDFASLGTNYIVTQGQASVDAQSSTFMTAQRANSAAATGNSIFHWYGGEYRLYVAFGSGTDYYLDMPATEARINGTWPDKDVAAVVTAWRNGANMALLRGATTIGSRSNASTLIGAGPSNLLLFPTTSPDYFASCFISWPSKIADSSISIASNRLESYLNSPPSVCPLDGLPTPVQAVSTSRRLLSSHTGSLLRLRNSVNNNEANIGFDGAGNLNTSAVTSLCGANAGQVVRLIDQVGSIDWFASQLNRQATLWNGSAFISVGAIARTAIRPTSTEDSYVSVSAGTTNVVNMPLTGDFTIFTVTRGRTESFNRSLYRGSPPGFELVSWFPDSRFYMTVAGTMFLTVEGTNSVASSPSSSFTVRRSGSTVQAWRNAESTPLISRTEGAALTPVMYFSFTDPNNDYCEQIIWNTALSDAQLSALEANAVAYYGLA
jgi:hypothetical protein